MFVLYFSSTMAVTENKLYYYVRCRQLTEGWGHLSAVFCCIILSVILYRDNKYRCVAQIQPYL